jgi:hypothetical protein
MSDTNSSSSNSSNGMLGWLWNSSPKSNDQSSSTPATIVVEEKEEVLFMDKAPTSTETAIPIQDHSTPPAPRPEVAALAAFPKDDEIEYLYLNENPFAVQPAERPTGTFGPLPMRTGYDKLLYGCGAAYLGGNFFRIIFALNKLLKF